MAKIKSLTLKDYNINWHKDKLIFTYYPVEDDLIIEGFQPSSNDKGHTGVFINKKDIEKLKNWLVNLK